MPKRSQSVNLRHSRDERQAILARFEEKTLSSEDRTVIANELGVSLSTIYRWMRQRDAPVEGADRKASTCISIQQALEVLSSPEIIDKFMGLEAVFKLIAWLRWPNSPHDHPAAIATCAITYLSRDSKATALDELPPDGLALVIKHISVDKLRKMCAGDAADIPDFNIWPLYNQNYDEIDYFADIANFLLAYLPRSKDRRYSSSLYNAHFAHECGLFTYKWPMTLETFRRYWAMYGPAAAFFYVRKYHLAQELVLDPSDTTFNASVDRIWQDRAETIAFLARCKTASGLLRDRLDYRTAGYNNFPEFPETLPSAALEVRPLPLGVDELLGGRKR